MYILRYYLHKGVGAIFILLFTSKIQAGAVKLSTYEANIPRSLHTLRDLTGFSGLNRPEYAML